MQPPLEDQLPPPPEQPPPPPPPSPPSTLTPPPTPPQPPQGYPAVPAGNPPSEPYDPEPNFQPGAAPEAKPTPAYNTAPPPTNEGPLPGCCTTFHAWKKTLYIIAFVLTVLVVGTVFYRSEIQGCGCPEHYSSFHKQRLQFAQKNPSLGFNPMESCWCKGDILSCKWDCGDGQIRGGNMWTTPSADDVSHDGPGVDDVLCPGKPDSEYCDCGGDCSAPVKFCECEDARAMSCCGKFANATLKTRKWANDKLHSAVQNEPQNAVAAHNKSESPGQWKGQGKEAPGAWQNKSTRANPGEFQDKGHNRSQYHDEGLKDSKWTGMGSEQPDEYIATASTRPRKHGGGRSMALLPLLWSHGEAAGEATPPGASSPPGTGVRW